MKVKLTLGERISLLGLLPAQSDYVTLLKLKELRGKLVISDEEEKASGFKSVLEGDKIFYRWSPDYPDVPVEFSIGELAEKAIIETLKQRDQAKELTEPELPLYKKFIEKK